MIKFQRLNTILKETDDLTTIKTEEELKQVLKLNTNELSIMLKNSELSDMSSDKSENTITLRILLDNIQEETEHAPLHIDLIYEKIIENKIVIPLGKFIKAQAYPTWIHI